MTLAAAAETSAVRRDAQKPGPAFFLLLLAMVVVYLLLVELAKSQFYRTRTRGPRPRQLTLSEWSGASGAGHPASSAIRRQRG